MAGSQRLIENLVIGGGGPPVMAVSSAIRVLEEYMHGYSLAGIKRVAGSSAGALAATLFAAPIDEDKRQDLLDTFPGMKLLDISFHSVFSFINAFFNKVFGKQRVSYSLCEGRALSDWYASVITGLGLDEDVTFAELEGKGFKDLYIFATDLSANKIVTFCKDKTPHIKLLDALLASAAIPLVFPRKDLDIEDNGERHTIVDASIGGANFAMHAFDSAKHIDGCDHLDQETYVHNNKTFGIITSSQSEFYTSSSSIRKIDSIWSFLSVILEYFIRRDFTNNRERDEDRVVILEQTRGFFDFRHFTKAELLRAKNSCMRFIYKVLPGRVNESEALELSINVEDAEHSEILDAIRMRRSKSQFFSSSVDGSSSVTVDSSSESEEEPDIEVVRHAYARNSS